MKKHGITLMDTLAAVVILSTAMLAILHLFLSSRAAIFGEIANVTAYREAANFTNLKFGHYIMPYTYSYEFPLNPSDPDSLVKGRISLDDSDSEYDIRKLELTIPFPTMTTKTDFKHTVEVYHAK